MRLSIRDIRRGWTAAIVLAATMLVLQGCASLGGLGDVIRKPEVRVIRAEIEELTFQGLRLRFDVEISNPNPVGVRLAGFDYEFTVEQSSVVSGALQDRFEIEPRGTSVVPVPLELTFSEIAQAAGAITDRDESEYQAVFGLSFQLPVLDVVRISTTRDGVLPVVQLPQVRVRRLQVRELTLQGARLVLVMDVENPNGFLIGVDSLDYRFGVSGREWARGRMRQKTRLVRRSGATLQLPLNLSFSEMGQSVRRVLTGSSPLSYELSVEMALTTDLPLLPTATVTLDRSGEVTLAR